MPVTLQTVVIRNTIFEFTMRALPTTLTLALFCFGCALTVFAAATRIDAVARGAKVTLLAHAYAISALAVHTVDAAGLHIAGITNVTDLALALAISAHAIAGAIIRARLALTKVTCVAIEARAFLIHAAASTVAVLEARIGTVTSLSGAVCVPACTAGACFRGDLTITAHAMNNADQ